MWLGILVDTNSTYDTANTTTDTYLKEKPSKIHPTPWLKHKSNKVFTQILSGYFLPRKFTIMPLIKLLLNLYLHIWVCSLEFFRTKWSFSLKFELKGWTCFECISIGEEIRPCWLGVFNSGSCFCFFAAGALNFLSGGGRRRKRNGGCLLSRKQREGFGVDEWGMRVIGTGHKGWMVPAAAHMDRLQSKGSLSDFGLHWSSQHW